MTMQKDTTTKTKSDFRAPAIAKIMPKGVADAGRGTVTAVAEVAGTPERVFKALTTNDVEKWWGAEGFYKQKDWKADVSVCGQWSVTVALGNGALVHSNGEFCALEQNKKIVMTRKFDNHPFQGNREVTITYQLDSSPHGTLITLHEEGYIGRSEAAYGNAEHWERVLGWLDTYLSAE